MGFERVDANANNTGYPATAYNVTKVAELGKHGAANGSGHGEVGEYVGTWEIDVTDLPSTSVSNEMIATIPAGSVIKECDLKVKSTLSGGVNFTCGLSQPDGTVIDADGLIAASTATTGYVAGAGALVGTALAADGQLTFTTDRTAGKVVVTVKYLLPA